METHCAQISDENEFAKEGERQCMYKGMRCESMYLFRITACLTWNTESLWEVTRLILDMMQKPDNKH